MSTNVGTLQAKLTLDMTDFTRGISKATSAAMHLGSALSTALGNTQGFSSIAKEATTAASQIKSMATATEQFAKQASSLSNAFQRMTQGMQANPFANMMPNVNQLLNDVSSIRGEVYSLNIALQNTNTILSQISTVLQHTGSLGSDLTRQMNQTTQAANNTRQNVDNITTGANRAAQATNSIEQHLKEASFNAKDIKRVLSGIVVSQAFYRMLGVLQGMSAAAYEFMCNIEQTQLSFKYLLGDAEVAAGLVDTLQDFAIASPLDTTGAADATRYLLNMGFAANNVVDVLSIITDAAVVSGQNVNETVYSISRALGQMLQSGTASAQEIRQLYNAGIPVTKILNEQLGLTGQEVKNIGELGIESGVVVNAILRGMKDQFAGAGLEMQQTVAGATSAIKDCIYVLSNLVFAGPFDLFRQKLVNISNALQQMVVIARRFGPGGLFESLVKDSSWQAIIRNVIGAFMQLGYALNYIRKIWQSLFGQMTQILIQALNIILPPIAILINGLTQLFYGLLNACPAVRYFFSALLLLTFIQPIIKLVMLLWRVISLGGICVKIASYIGILLKTLWTFATLNPVITGILAFIAVILTLTGVIQKCINKIRELFSWLGGKLAKYTSQDKTVKADMNIGFDPNTILQPWDKEAKKGADDYKDSVEGAADALDDVADKAKKAKKATKDNFNQSFDEVYGINPKDNSNTGNKDDPTEDIPDIGDFAADLGDMLDGIAFNTDGVLNNFMDAWWELIEAIKAFLAKHVGAILVALAAAIATLVLTKNPWLALIASLVGFLWEPLCKALKLDPNAPSNIGTAIGAMLGASIGWLIGGPLGALVGGSIGALVGNTVGNIITGFKTGNWNYSSLGRNIGAIIGAGIGWLIGGPLGALLGGGIGALCGQTVGKIVEGFKTGKWDIKGISMALGGLIGAGIGAIVGGPVGAIIGGAIGTAVGWIVNKFIQADWSEVADGITRPFKALGTKIKATWAEIWNPIKQAFDEGDWLSLGVNIVKGILKGFASVIILVFDTVQALWDALVNAICTIFGIHSPARNMMPYGEYILKGILQGILTIMSTISTWVKDNIYTPIKNALITYLSIKNFTAFGTNVINSIKNGITNALLTISAWIKGHILTPIRTALNEHFTLTAFLTFGKNLITSIKNGITNSLATISSWIKVNILNPIRLALNTHFTIKAFLLFGKNIILSIKDGIINALASISTWVKTNIFNPIRDAIGLYFKSDTSDLLSLGINIIQGLLNGMLKGLANIGSWVKNNIYDRIVDAIKDQFGIHSPAKNMMPLGDYVSQGFGKGIVNGLDDVIKTLQAPLNDVMDSFNLDNNPLSMWADDVWSSVNTQITKAIDKIYELVNLTNSDLSMNTNLQGLGISRDVFTTKTQNTAETTEQLADAFASRLGPLMVNMRQNDTSAVVDTRRPLYVGTLVADERGLRELNRRMRRISDEESRRRGQ